MGPAGFIRTGPVGFADINGDGFADFYGWSGTDILIHWLEDLSGVYSWSTSPETMPWEPRPAGAGANTLGFTDLDDDGVADFWGWRPSTGHIEVHLSNGDGTFTAGPSFFWSAALGDAFPIGVADLNGDGRDDFWGWAADGTIQFRYTQVSANGTVTFSPAHTFNWVDDANRDHPLGFADINGDGLADFWAWAQQGGTVDGQSITVGRLYSRLSQGDGTMGALQELSWDSPNYEHPWTVGFADLNGDGKADFYGWKADGEVAYHLARGNGTLDSTEDTIAWPGVYGQDGPIGFADVNGDGRADFFGWRDPTGVEFKVTEEEVGKSDLLKELTNGFGGSTYLEYRSSTAYTNTALPFPLFTLSKQTTVAAACASICQEPNQDDLITPQVREYGYGGGFYHRAERKFRGFAQVTMAGPVGADGEQAITTTWFHQGDETEPVADDPHVAEAYVNGAPYRTEVTDANGALYGRTETTYQADDGVAPFYTPPARVVTDVCEAGACTHQTQTDYTYDAYGNVTSEIHSGTGTDTRTIVRTFSSNEDDWVVGLPLSDTRWNHLGAQVARTDWYYDGSGGCASPSGTQSPTIGNLTRTQRWFAGGAAPAGVPAFSHPDTAQEYDAYGNVTCQSDANGHPTSIEYDPLVHTFPTTVTNAEGHMTTTTYYGVNGSLGGGLYGQVETVTDPNEALTRSVYDALGRVTLVTHPDALTTETKYEGWGNVGTQRIQIIRQFQTPDPPLPVTSLDKLEERYYFDGLGRIIKVWTPGANAAQWVVTETRYDDRGLVRTVSVPNFTQASTLVTTLSYDLFGRRLQATRPNGEVDETCYAGWVSATVAANGQKRRTERDAFGQVRVVQEYATPTPGAPCNAATPGTPSATTQYTYDALGNLTQVQDTLGHLTVLQYDSLSRKRLMRDPDMGEWQFWYDAAGNLVWQQDAKANTTYFQYDALNRRQQKDAGTKKTLGQGDVVYTYDRDTGHGTGRLTHMADTSGSTEFWYDPRGRVTQTDKTVGGHTFRTLTTYDGIDRQTSITYPDGSVVHYEYPFGEQWVQRVSETVQGVDQEYAGVGSYTPLGQPLQMGLNHDQIETTYHYPPEENFRLTELKTERPSDGTVLQHLGYDYFHGGNVQHIIDPQDASHTQTFLYDGMDRLDSAVGPYGTIDYDYDAIGNMTRNTRVSAEAYEYTSAHPHAVTRAGENSYTYDDNGNMLSGGGRSLEYDTENRPIKITVQGAASAPTITAPPQDVTVTAPAGALFTVEAAGTAPLTYQWRQDEIPIAGATGATYTHTPTVPGDSGATFDVVVTNAAGSVTSQPATLTVLSSGGPALLLNDDFGDGDFTGWSIVDQGTRYDPSAWSASTGTLVQSRNIYGGDRAGDSLPKPGTHVWYPAGTAWSDYTLTLTLASSDNDALGVLFRYQDVNNYYRFSWDRQGGYRRVVKVVNGTVTLLAEDAVPYTSNQIYAVDIRAEGAELTVSVDGTQIFDLTEGSHATGTVGLYSWYNDDARFDDVEVEAIGAGSGMSALAPPLPTQREPVRVAVRDPEGRASAARTTPLTFSGTEASVGHHPTQRLVSSRSEPRALGRTQVKGASEGLPRSRVTRRGASAHDSPTVPGYLHLAAFRPPVKAMPGAMKQVAETQAAQQQQLDEVLVRTQTTPPGEVVTSFVYDGEGSRVIKKVEDSGTVSVTVYIGQHYVCQGTEEALANGDPLACAKLIFANGQRIAMAQVDNPTSVTYFHQDHLGSSSVITDETGVVEQEYTYYPFGAIHVQSGAPENDVHYKYTGQEADGSTGLYDYHARLYDPHLGRFISPDTIVPEPFNPQAFNRYSYVVNNPLKYTDPTGQAGCAVFVMGSTVNSSCYDTTPPQQHQTNPSNYNPSLQPHSFSTVPVSSPFQSALPISLPTSRQIRQAADIAVSLFPPTAVVTGLIIAATGRTPIGQDEVSGLDRYLAPFPGLNKGGALLRIINKTINQRKARQALSLPALDKTGKLHGRPLPRPEDFSRYSRDELRQLLSDLKKSVPKRIETTTELGRHRPHGQRQGEEQQLIRQLEKYLSGS